MREYECDVCVWCTECVYVQVCVHVCERAKHVMCTCMDMKGHSWSVPRFGRGW